MGTKNTIKRYNLLKGIVICKESGEYLLDFILDTHIDPVLLSSFVGALRLFGDNLGEIEEINIKGLDVNMIIVYKYNLIFVAIMDKSFSRDNIRDEAVKALDMFYTLYRVEMNQEFIDLTQFESFKKILTQQIEDYFKNNIKLKRDNEIGDFGFFTEAIKKLRSKNT